MMSATSLVMSPFLRVRVTPPMTCLKKTTIKVSFSLVFFHNNNTNNVTGIKLPLVFGSLIGGRGGNEPCRIADVVLGTSVCSNPCLIKQLD